jgi:hypothetical protein
MIKSEFKDEIKEIDVIDEEDFKDIADANHSL